MDRITKVMEKVRQKQQDGAHQEPDSTNAFVDEAEIRKFRLSPQKLRERRIITGDEGDESSQAYKVLRTRVWHQMRTNGWQSLGVTSANPGEGKSLTAINLAINLAMMEIGRKIILVDLDMRRPSLCSYFGVHPEYGVSDYLVGGVPLQNVMINIGIERLVLIPGTASLANSSEILSSPRMARLMQELRSLFPSRIVIFDLPPILATDDVLVMAPNLNAFLLVIEEGKTPSKDVTKVVELLKDANLVGTVLNKSQDPSQKYYGYGY